MLSKITRKQVFHITIPTIFFLIFLFFFNHQLKPVYLKLTTAESLCKPGSKIILFWTKFFEVDDFYFGFGEKPFQQCHVHTCCATNNRNLLDESAAIIFHIRDLNISDLPPHRHPHQRWIFFLLESPDNTPQILANFNNTFNWTMTYRTDSDVYTPYPVLESDKTGRNLNIQQNTSLEDMLGSLVRSKKKKVAWFVSNCMTFSGREKYAAELQKYIDVDIYGACGTLECVDRFHCYKMMERDYKFYLAFENSVCRDYVTEKFYNALLFQTVPIVFGGANYQAIAPKGSYIEVKDYPSVRDLAEYLKYLDRDDAAYLRYFEWRKFSEGEKALPRIHHSWCRLCSMLNNNSLPVRYYSNIHSWWFESKCEKYPRELPVLLNDDTHSHEYQL